MSSSDFTKQDINKLILNYLITEGYESTSLKFAKEMGIVLQNEEEQTPKLTTSPRKELIGLKSIKFRKKVKLLVLKGEIQNAIDELNLNYPELLETNQFLYFKLLLLNLIEMIKVHNKKKQPASDQDDHDPNKFILTIIKFAQDKLTNKAIKNPHFMEELELTMTLLLYSNNDPIAGQDSAVLPKKLNRLLEFKLRRDIADLINKAILLKDIDMVDTSSRGNVNDTRSDYDQDFDFEDVVDKTEDKSTESSNLLIDSNLKKLIKFWIWSENTLATEYPDVEFNKFDL